jgi:hypothetical protein
MLRLSPLEPQPSHVSSSAAATFAAALATALRDMICVLNFAGGGAPGDRLGFRFLPTNDVTPCSIAFIEQRSEQIVCLKITFMFL